VVDSSGNPVRGSDGRPLVVPPGSRPALDASASLPTASTTSHTVAPSTVSTHVPSTDSTGWHGSSTVSPTLPAGSVITSHGVALGPDGKPLLDASGHAVHFPPGSTVASDGTVRGPDGKPLSSLNQTQASDYGTPQLGVRPSTASGGGGGGGGGHPASASRMTVAKAPANTLRTVPSTGTSPLGISTMSGPTNGLQVANEGSLAGAATSAAARRTRPR